MDQPVMRSAAESPREPLVRAAVGRLQDLVSQAEQLVERLTSAFGSVLLDSPTEESEKKAQPDALLGCDLGQTLTGVADNLNNHFRSIERVIEKSDL